MNHESRITRLLSTGLVALLTVTLCVKAVPSWWLGDLPDDVFGQNLLIGRGCADIAESGGEAQAWQYARMSAIGDAALRLAPDVVQETTISEAEFGEGTSSRVESAYQQRHLVRASLRNVPEMREQKRSRIGGTVYLMVGIPRTELAEVYRRRIVANARTAAEHITAAKRETEQQPVLALQQYAAALAAFEELHENLNVHYMLNDSREARAVELDSVQSLPPRADIETAMAALSARLPRWTRDRFFAELLAPLADDRPAAKEKSYTGDRFLIHPLTYCDGDFISPFGANLADALIPVVAARFGWIPASTSQDAKWIFSGRVRETGGGVQITLRRQTSDGNAVAVSVALLTDFNAREWGEVLPPNWESALSDEAALLKTLNSDPLFRIEMRTDRMSDGLAMFRYGDTPRMWIRSTMPATIRVLHVFSDGMRTLVADAFPIPMDKLNQWVPLPVRMRITPPAGIEQILVQAVSGGNLPQLTTERVETGPGRYREIVNGDLGTILAVSRGSELEEGALFSETVYSWTVVQK